MAEGRPSPTPSFSLADWLAQLRADLDAADDPRLRLSPAEESVLLDLARVAAHTSERIAAPLTTFVAGLALADLSADDRLDRLRSLLRRLEAATKAP